MAERTFFVKFCKLEAFVISSFDTLTNVIVVEGMIINVEPIPIKILGKITFGIAIVKLSPANIIQAIKTRITP
ncbi:hypothetical protein IKQ21_04995, partial [bacterium]|nr:hypothetical protein [bacterium]